MAVNDAMQVATELILLMRVFWVMGGVLDDDHVGWC